MRLYLYTCTWLAFREAMEKDVYATNLQYLTFSGSTRLLYLYHVSEHYTQDTIEPSITQSKIERLHCFIPTFVTSPSARPSFRKYITTPLPPFCASLTASSTPKMRYGRHVQISDPKTSDPLHSSCTRSASRQFGFDKFATSPKIYTVNPPIGGRKTLMSGRVMSSGNEPPVISKSVRRRVPSSIQD